MKNLEGGYKRGGLKEKGGKRYPVPFGEKKRGGGGELASKSLERGGG